MKDPLLNPENYRRAHIHYSRKEPQFTISGKGVLSLLAIGFAIGLAIGVSAIPYLDAPSARDVAADAAADAEADRRALGDALVEKYRTKE